MNENTQNPYLIEIAYQKKMLLTLQRWLKKCFIISSFAVVLIAFGASLHPYVKTIAIVVMVLVVAGMILLGLAIRNGRSNLTTILNVVDTHRK